MSMTKWEKAFVNAPRHSRRVSDRAVAVLHRVPLTPGQRLLDVGCGNGGAAFACASAYGLDVTGLDCDPDQIALAEAARQGREQVHFLTGDATALPFADHTFDLIFTAKTLHHIVRWQCALEEMTRVVKPGGYLIGSDFLVPRWMVWLGGRSMRDRFGVVTKALLMSCLNQHAMTIIWHQQRPWAYTWIGQKS